MKYLQLRNLTVLTEKDVSEPHEVFEVRKSSKPDSPLQSLLGTLGWVVTRSIHSSHNYRNILANLVTSDKNLHYQVEKFWKVEQFVTKTTLKSRTDSKANCRHRDLILFRDMAGAVDILVRTMQLTADDHHEKGLLWR